MNRRSIFAALAAAVGLKAHDSHTVTVMEMKCGEPVEDADGRGVTQGCSSTGKTHEESRYKPDQCPVCGEKADPYVRETYDPNHGFCQIDPSPPQYDGLVKCKPPVMEPWGPMERVARCRGCSAAFWQDAVK